MLPLAVAEIVPEFTRLVMVSLVDIYIPYESVVPEAEIVPVFVRLVNVNSQNDIDEVKGFFKIMEDFVEENYERLKKISN